MKATIFDIQRTSFVDGPGIRTTVFFKGCNLRCAWCHNPESQRFEKQIMFYKDKCIGCGKCFEKCHNQLKNCDFCGQCEIYCPSEARKICGKEYTVEEVYEQIVQDVDFYKTSGGGVTFSGGECMLQLDFLKEILELCHKNGIHTAVDTAGCVPYENFESILPYTDMFLYDVKLLDEEKHKKYVGASNKLILENLAKLLQNNVKIWVRVPLIGGVNDNIEEISALRDFFKVNGFPDKVELLPYHAMGENKSRALGCEPVIFTTPDKDKVTEFQNILNS